MKAMFEPSAPIEYKPAIVKRRMPPYTGMAAFVTDVFETTKPEPRGTFETPYMRQVDTGSRGSRE